MFFIRFSKIAAIIVIGLAGILMTGQKGAAMDTSAGETIKLPEPEYDSATSIEHAFLNRRSERSYAERPLALGEISQLLWAAQGITGRHGFRTAPSAGALYPLEVFLAAGEVQGLDSGIYKYIPEVHALKQKVAGDKREKLWAEGLRQPAIKRAPAVFVFTAVFERTMKKYGPRGRQYALMEAGHAAQNLCLQTVGMDMAAVPIGAFDETGVVNVLELDRDTTPLYLLPVGKKE